MEKRIKSFDGTTINYQIARIKNNNPWLIFIHGAGGDLTAWRKERYFFHKKGYSTIAIDLRGHGKSDRPSSPTDYALDNFAQDIDAVLTHEKIADFSLLGHFGGMVAITYHKLFPTKSQSYVLIDTTYKAPKVLKRIFHSHPFFLHILNHILEKEDLRKKHFSHVKYRKFIGTGDYDVQRIMSDISHTSFKSWLFTYESLSDFNGIKTMKSIKQPVLIIEGAEDTIFDVMKAKRINKLIRSSTLDIVPNENHIIVLNNPRILEQEILKFVSSDNT